MLQERPLSLKLIFLYYNQINRQRDRIIWMRDVLTNFLCFLFLFSFSLYCFCSWSILVSCFLFFLLFFSSSFLPARCLPLFFFFLFFFLFTSVCSSFCCLFVLVFFLFTSFNSSILLCPFRLCHVVMLKTVIYGNQVHSESLKNSAGTGTKAHMLYSHLQHHNDTIIKQTQGQRHKKKGCRNEGRTQKDAGRLLYKIFYLLSLFVSFERVVPSLRVRESWRPNITEIFWPRSYGRQRCVFLVLHGCSTGALAFLTTSRLPPQLYSPVSTGSLNSTDWNSTHRPYITFKLTRADMDTPPRLLLISADRDVSLPLSLEWPVWSSSSGNNCHPVQRSLSSGASVYESIMGSFFYLVPFHQPISAHAISSHNCHQNVSPPSGALPWMAFLAGSTGQNITEGNQKAPFSIATTPRCMGGYYSFPWTAPLYPWYIPYVAEC